MYDEFKEEFNMNDLDAILILKDILYQKHKIAKKKTK